MKRLLIVDDDQGLVNLLKRFLEAEGFTVDTAYDHAEGLKSALAGDHEIIILDVMLPGGSGFELLKSLRQQSGVPVLLLTARGEAVDRILGLEIGADDYLAKPFDPRELVARIRAILRRTQEGVPGSARTDADEVLSVGDIEMSMALLLRHAGNVVTREQIAEVALGRPLNPFDRSVDVHVSRLRKKLGNFAGSDDLIRPIRGIGYFMPAATTPERSRT